MNYNISLFIAVCACIFPIPRIRNKKVVRSGTYCTAIAYCTIDLALKRTTDGMMKNKGVLVEVLYEHPMFVKTSKPYDYINFENIL
jgi:hypothetical protein